VVTVAELRFGVECSDPMYLDEKRKRLSDLLLHLQIIPISAAVDIYALEKARLRRDGELISDFDLLIGATAIQQDMIMVTNNTKHLSKIAGINITDWTDR
jgi:tRNA(fMet)-specific endonuclease VapC